MPVIALVGNKGGAGKTTLAVNLANLLARDASTAMLDADPQGSSIQWRAMTDAESAPQVYEAIDLHEQQVQVLGNRFTYLVIDCPPSVQAPQTHMALRVADIALIPVQPSPVDLWATVHIEAAVREAREVNPGLRAVLVINQLEPRTQLSRLMRVALAELDLPVAETAIRRRAVYRSSALEGKCIWQMGRRGEPALCELEQLIQEVVQS